MTTTRHPRFSLGIVAALSLALPGLAHATLYEMTWNSKWGQGDIVYDAAVADTDPDPAHGDYFGSIVSYDVTGWFLFNRKQVAGTSGSISVTGRGPDEGCNACPGAALTFQLGSAALPYDPNGWHIAMAVRWGASDFGDDLPTDHWSATWDDVHATLDPNGLGGQSYNTIGGFVLVTIEALPAPVPEPTTPALLGLGLGLLALVRRRPSARATTAPAPGSS